MLEILEGLHKEELGTDTVEFALIGLVIALGAVVGMGRLANAVNNEFTKYAARLS